ncbi:MAG: 6-hydroxymethylpterin diphosphokinase MptE-like protein [Treponemataceae bacterium]
MPRRIQARRGFSISYKGKTLLSLIDPVDSSERVAAVLPVFKQTLYVCPSPLFGYGIQKLFDRITPDSAILCIESDPELLSLSTEELPEDIKANPRVRLIRATDGASACSYLRREFGPRRFRRVVLAKLNGGYALNEKTYTEVESALRDDVALEWANAMTLLKLGRRYALNAIRNLAILPSSHPLCAGTFSNDPILVLGAGPSLDFVEPILSSRRHFRIICVDTALIPLLERGIVPDMVVVLEAQHWNLRDFIGSGKTNCPLALDLSSLPRGAFTTNGARFLFSVDWAPLRLLDRLKTAGLRPPEIPPLGSVGLAAVAIALRAGTGAVVLAGLDFAYDIGAYHARSSPSRLDRLLRTDRLKSLIDPAPAFRDGTVKANGKLNRPIRTDPALRGYRNLFQREFVKIDRLYDAGDRGLELGIKTVTLIEAMKLLEGEHPRQQETNPETLPYVADSPKTIAFIDCELARLHTLRSILTGNTISDDLERLVDECDYLWSHFPECAGADGKRPLITDIAFLKRVRAEIDPFAKAFNIARSELIRT